jgi:hypothetical protein
MKANKYRAEIEAVDRFLRAELRGWAARQSPPAEERSELLRRAANNLSFHIEVARPRNRLREFFQNNTSVMTSDHPVGRPFQFGSSKDSWSWAWSLHMATSIRLAT